MSLTNFGGQDDDSKPNDRCLTGCCPLQERSSRELAIFAQAQRTSENNRQHQVGRGGTSRKRTPERHRKRASRKIGAQTGSPETQIQRKLTNTCTPGTESSHTEKRNRQRCNPGFQTIGTGKAVGRRRPKSDGKRLRQRKSVHAKNRMKRKVLNFGPQIRGGRHPKANKHCSARIEH